MHPILSYPAILLMALLMSVPGWSQDPADLRCISVNPDGSVTLQWIKPADGTDFNAYEIYFASAESGPWSLAGAVNDYNTESFTHTGVNALTSSFYYYVVADYLSGPSANSAILQSMLMLLYNPNAETAQLSWNAPSSPLLPGMSDTYEIYMEYPAGIWSMVGSTTDTQFEYSFQFCNKALDVVNFQVSIADPIGGCNSLSSIMGSVMLNYFGPAIPQMDSVSITPAGEVIIGWQVNPSLDTEGYIIYLVTGTNDSIDYVAGINSTTYIDPLANPCEATFSYAISAIDSCGNGSPGTYDTPQNTLLIQDLQYDPCWLNTQVDWNPYLNFDPPLDRYELFASEAGGPFERIAVLAPGETGFLHENLMPNTTYEYFVRAFSQDDQKSSSSCRRSITTYDSPRPDYMYQRYASVTENEDVEISFYTDTSAYVLHYNILRSENMAGPFAEIGVVYPQDEEVLTYIDESANVDETSYYYQVTVVDTCGIETAIDNLSKTIWLQVSANPDRTNELSWTSYEAWDAPVERYDVYRLLDGVPEPTPLTSLPSTTLAHVDDVSGLAGNNALIEYLVIAYEATGNQYGFQDEARSNKAMAMQESNVFVPNAFRPNGLNPRFRPVSSFIGGGSYLFAVYDRWGRQVFQTNDPAESWDGRINGEIAPEAVYSWVLRYRDGTNVVRESSGNVMLLY